MSNRNLIAEIKSKDIDKSKITETNMQKLSAEFPQCDADTLARYLLARKNKIKAASKLLRNAENWRAQNWPVLKKDCINEIQKGKIFVTGTDKEGRPLLVFRSRFHNAKDRDPEEMAKMVCFCYYHITLRLRTLIRLCGGRSRPSRVFLPTSPSSLFSLIEPMLLEPKTLSL